MKTKPVMMLVVIGLIWSGVGASDPCFYGGDGACYVLDDSTNPFHLDGPQVKLSSAADQSFARGYAPVPSSALTITAGTNSPGITTTNAIAVWIPAEFVMAWDETKVNATISGTAAGKVSTTVSYTNSSHCLLIAVTDNFDIGEYVTVSGLAFKDFLGSGSSRLELDYDNDGLDDVSDDKQITIQGVFVGGLGDHYMEDALTNSFYLEGPLVTLSSAADQSFARGYAPVPSSALTITAGTNSPGITTTNAIAVWIPAEFVMAWDETKVNATISGTAAGKVSTTVSYTNSSHCLLIAVTANFAAGEYVTVSGLAFKDFLGSGSSRLELDYDNDGLADAWDDKQITIEGVFVGGDGANYCLHQTLLEKCLHPVGTLISIARLGL